MKAKDYIEEVLEIEVPETPVINGSWFAEKRLPMIVACVSCGMTMSLFSADIKKDGTTFCTSCAPTDEEYDKAFEDLEEEDDEIRIVRCNDCYWTGHEDNLEVIDDVEHCPKCHRSDCLMDMHNEFEEYTEDEDYEDLDSLGDMHSCDISGICSGMSCDLYYECNMKCKG